MDQLSQRNPLVLLMYANSKIKFNLKKRNFYARPSQLIANRYLKSSTSK
jgi:hypothetical protein